MQIGIGVICTLLGVLITVFTFTRNRDRDVKSDASELAVIKTKLDTISLGIEQIRIDIRANEMRVSDIAEKLIRVEESNKLAHKRIDKIESDISQSN